MFLANFLDTDLNSTLYIAGFFPMTSENDAGGLGRGVLPAVKLALADVNADNNVLKDYKLEMIWHDTQVRHV